MMTHAEAVEFANRWLPVWSGNRPMELDALYTDDGFSGSGGRKDF